MPRIAMPRLQDRDRGWASRDTVLEWKASPPSWWVAERLGGRWVIEVQACEAIARCELRVPGNRRWVDIGSFPSVAAARRACERDAVERCRREELAATPVDIRIAPRR